MARMKFTKTEREQFVPGTEIEWQNGTHWHPGVIAGAIFTATWGPFQFVPVIHRGRRTATVAPGQHITGAPTKVRLPKEQS